MLTPIAITLAGGLATIVFKWPRIYLSLMPTLTWAWFLTFFAVATWDNALKRAFTALSPLINDADKGKAKAIIDGASSPLEMSIVLLCAMFYFGFLWWLAHEILHHEKEAKRDGAT